MTRRSESVSGPHWTRRRARSIERALQAALEKPGGPTRLVAVGRQEYVELPSWARGVRVRRVGLLSWQVEATSWRGH